MELSIHNVVEITAGPVVLLPGTGAFVREINIDSVGPLWKKRVTLNMFSNRQNQLVVADEQPEAVPA